MTITAIPEIPFSVKGRFYRSVNIASDISDPVALDGYILTPTGRDLIQRIAVEKEKKHGSVAWSLTGSYGTGKSSFALFLSHLFGNTAPDNHLIQEIRNSFRIEDEMLIIPITGRRRNIAHSIHDSLLLSLKKSGIKWKGPGADDIGGAFDWALEKVLSSSKTGIMLIVDEFGKFLEHAADDPSADLFEMQILAEAAQRSNGKFVIVNLLHMAYSDYLGDLDRARQAEWQKVQGRFTDVPFREPNEQFLKLISKAIEFDEEEQFVTSIKSKISKKLKCNTIKSAAKGMNINLIKLLPECTPLGPIAALLALPIFRSSLAQNERSLFTFLTSDEPFAFQDGLRRKWGDNDSNKIYNLPIIYDYLSHNFNLSSFSGLISRRLREVETALGRIDSEATRQTVDLVKSIGLIATFGSTTHIRANKEILSIAVGSQSATAEALNYLIEKKIIIYRKYDDSYSFWEGSDVDLEEAFNQAKKEVDLPTVSDLLNEMVEFKPMFARRHYIKTGFLRLFNVEVISSRELMKTGFNLKCLPTEPGRIIYVLTRDDDKREAVIEAVRDATRSRKHHIKRTIIVVCKPHPNSLEFCHEYSIWSWLSSNLTELQDDRIARKEVEKRIYESHRSLIESVGPILGHAGYPNDFANQSWIHCGKLLAISSQTDIQYQLSSICDDAFTKCPVFHNELVNRSKPSAPATRACNRVIEMMLINEGKKRLGIIGYPPEITVFEGLLKKAEIVIEDENGSYFQQPTGDWKPLWRGIMKFLKDNSASKVPIEKLYRHVEAEPFGLKRGFLPVIICALHKILKDDLAFYESGLYTPIPDTEMFERLLRRPDIFEIQLFELSEECNRALEKLHEVLLGERKKSPSLLDVIKPLVIFVARLPPHVKKTKNLQPESALKVRNALLDASDPYDLTFTVLPNILGVSLDEQNGVEEFVSKMMECVSSLRQSYPSLLNKIEHEIRSELRLTGDEAEVKKQLISMGKNLSSLSADMTINLLLREMRDLGDRDWREVVARVVNKGIPPKDWIDVQVTDFSVNLRRISLELLRLQEVAKERVGMQEDTIIRIGILRDNYSEHREILRYTSNSVKRIDKLRTEFEKWLTSYSNEQERLERLAAVAEVLHSGLSEGGGQDE